MECCCYEVSLAHQDREAVAAGKDFDQRASFRDAGSANEGNALIHAGVVVSFPVALRPFSPVAVDRLKPAIYRLMSQ